MILPTLELLALAIAAVAAALTIGAAALYLFGLVARLAMKLEDWRYSR